MTTKHTPQQTIAGHTPGPWFVYEVPSAYNRCDYSIEYRTKAHNNPGFIGKVWGRYEGGANAHLIAAAPEMLEALIAIKKQLGEVWANRPDGDTSKFPYVYEYNLITDAIAKAKGQTSQAPQDKQEEV